MENALKRGLPLLLLLAATAAFASYQSPASTPSNHALQLPSFQSQAPEQQPEVLLIYDEQGTLDTIELRPDGTPAVYTYEAVMCLGEPARSEGGWSQNGVTFPEGNKPQDGATAVFAGWAGIGFRGHNRYYDPELGRFTQPDPMGYQDSMNLYQAFGQSPMNFGDPMGLQLRWYDAFGIGADFLGSLAEDWARMQMRPVRATIETIKAGNEFTAGQREAIADAWRRGNMRQVRGAAIRTVTGTWDVFQEHFVPEELKSINPIHTYNRKQEAEAYKAKAEVEAIGMGTARPEVRAELAANLKEATSEYNMAALSHGISMLGWVAIGAQGLNALAPEAQGLSGEYATWNEFQAGTKGQFTSRTEAAKAWQAYKEANGIITGVTRSSAARRGFLQSLVNDYRTPSWMKQWLQEGLVPPGYQVEHRIPLSIGGADTAANMRLQAVDMHIWHHLIYDPWNW